MNETIATGVKASTLMSQNWEASLWDQDITSDDPAGGLWQLDPSKLRAGTASGRVGQDATLNLGLSPQ